MLRACLRELLGLILHDFALYLTFGFKMTELVPPSRQRRQRRHRRQRSASRKCGVLPSCSRVDVPELLIRVSYALRYGTPV